ncbi:MAG: GIY-YIG nuclease family protein [Candidatus Sungbacteria bacterium]|nr:GIY-YIG nuclease family protein [Candidatus Sungbacteria bacterium]
MFSYVYILRSQKDAKMYIGCTNDLKKRISMHNKGLSFATKTRIPLKLIYYEAFPNREGAENRERFFKTGWGRQYIQRTLYNYFNAKT